MDNEGRYIIIYGCFEGIKCIIVNIYIPPPFSYEVFQEILIYISDKPNIPFLMVGDYNHTQNDIVDRVSFGNNVRPPGNSYRAFLHECGWIDPWRLKNPYKKEFSCFTKSTGVLSRIDYALVNDIMLRFVRKVRYETRGISDHSPVLIILDTGINRSRFDGWSIKPSVFKEILSNIDNSAWIVNFFDQNLNSAPLDIVWETFKAYIRGIMREKWYTKKKV